MTQKSPTSCRLPAEQRRLKLIETAVDLFSKKGFSGTTTKEIATAAGVTEAIVFRHFATKQELYTAILEARLKDVDVSAFLARVQEFMDRRDDEGLLRFLMSQIVEQYRTEGRFERFVLFAALEGQELAMLHHQIAKPIMKVFIEYIERRQRAGAMRKGDPAVILMAMAGIAKFYAAQKYVYGTCQTKMPDADVVETLVTLLMDGLRGKRVAGGKK